MSFSCYPFEEQKHQIDDEYWEFLQEHHECAICGETFHESTLHRTNFGWIDFDCYNAIVNDPDTTKAETPIIL